MADFEYNNFKSILNSDNLGEEDITFKEGTFDIFDDFDGDLSGSDKEEDKESESEEEEIEDDKEKSEDDEYDTKTKVKSRDKETENFESFLNEDKTNKGEYDDLVYRISSNYDKIKLINDGKLPSVFPNISEIKTIKQAKQVFRLTSKKLDSMMVNDALTEFIPVIGDVLGNIFNGERSIFGHKPDVSGYGMRLRTKLSTINTDISTISDRIIQVSFLSSLIKLFSIFGLPLYGTVKDNADRSKQGLKKDKMIELNKKLSKNL